MSALQTIFLKRWLILGLHGVGIHRLRAFSRFSNSRNKYRQIFHNFHAPNYDLTSQY